MSNESESSGSLTRALRPDNDLQASAPAIRPTLWQDIVAGLLGVGISLLCLLPPIVHFVTGPLAPLIGGFFGGGRNRGDGQDALLIGLTIGVVLGLIVGLTTGVVDVFLNRDSGWIRIALLLGGGVFVYASFLGTIGAVLGGRMGRTN